MSIEFKWLETGVFRQINSSTSESLSPPETAVVRDLTGDGIPDFLDLKLEPRISRGLEVQGFDGGTYIFSLTSGSLSSTGNITRLGNPLLLAQLPWSMSIHPDSRRIVDVDIADFNSDGMLDISFWKFVNGEVGYTQLILLATKTDSKT